MRRPRITSRGARRMEGRREERTRLRRRCRSVRAPRTPPPPPPPLRDVNLTSISRKWLWANAAFLTRHLTYMHHTHSRRYRWRCSMQSSSCSLQIWYSGSPLYFTRKWLRMIALCDTCPSFDHVGVYHPTSEKSTFDISAPHQNTIIAFALSLPSIYPFIFRHSSAIRPRAISPFGSTM